MKYEWKKIKINRGASSIALEFQVDAPNYCQENSKRFSEKLAPPAVELWLKENMQGKLPPANKNLKAIFSWTAKPVDEYTPNETYKDCNHDPEKSVINFRRDDNTWKSSTLGK